MKIVFTSYSSSPEYDQPDLWLKRIEGYTGILENLAKNNSVTGIERINYEGTYKQNGVHYHFIKQKRKTVRFPFRIHRLIKKSDPDVVFINGLIFPLQVILLRLKLGRRVKIILIHRSEKSFTGVKKYLQRFADRFVNAYFFSSAAFSKEWKRNISIKKIYEVITLSSIFHIKDRAEAVKLTTVQGNPVFIWVGSLIPRKDPLIVIKAFFKFVQAQPAAKLYMVYQEDQLLAEVSTLLENNKQYKDSVILVGNILHSQLLYWYNSADFFISSSHAEGTGVVLSEAMSCGCIPIITDIKSFKKMTGPGKCGLLYEPGNERDLLAALSKSIELNSEKERIKVLKQFNEELSFEAIGRKIENVFVLLDNR